MIINLLQIQAKVFCLGFFCVLLPNYFPFLEEILLKKEEE